MVNGKSKNGQSFEFTEEEYRKIAELIIAGDEEGYELLYKRVDSNLKNYVSSKCRLMGVQDFENDVMQILKTKLFVSIVTGYIKRGGVELNPDYRGLSAWIKVIADNIILDILRAQNKFYSRLAASMGDPDSEDGETDILASVPDDVNVQDMVVEQMVTVALLNDCFSTVIDSSVSVYKIIAWLGHRILLYLKGGDNAKSNRLLVEQAEEKTLFDMYDLILDEADRIEWLKLTDDQKRKIELALAKIVDGKTMGNRLFSEFYMNKGQEETISDWRNRIDKMLREKFKDRYISVAVAREKIESGKEQ